MAQIKYHSVLTNIPEEFVVERKANGVTTYFPKMGGLMFLANTMGKPVLQCKNVSTKSDETVFECSGWLIPNKETLEKLGLTPESPLWDMWKIPTITHGTSNAGNTKDNMLVHATVMAETRAIVRCLRILTGCSYTAYEELAESGEDNSASKVSVSSASDLLDMESLGNAKTREGQIKELQTIKDKQPYRAIIDRVCKDNRVSFFTGLNDAGVKTAYDLCMKQIHGQ